MYSTTLKKVAFTSFVFIGLYIIPYILFEDSYLRNYAALSFIQIFFDILSTLALAIAITAVCLYIDKRMNKSFPWTRFAMKRLLLQTIVQIVSVFLLLICFAIVSYLIIKIFDIQFATSNSATRNVWYFFSATIFLTLVITSVNTINYLIANWKEAITNAASLQIKAAENKQIAAETELQALRLQLDPHFVFNNLSVLSELILKDQQLGFEYTENFTKIYRYLLVNSKKKLIPLSDELKFLHAYRFLLRHRIGNGVLFEMDISASSMNLKIAPVTLQLLVENAIKYNRIEKENPLIIKIFTTDSKELVVFNNKLPLMKKPFSSGIGLANISNRYFLLSEKEPSIEETSTTFTVIIPLLL